MMAVSCPLPNILTRDTVAFMYSAIVRTSLIVFLFSIAPGAALADVVSELHIGTDGVFSAKNLVVTQKAGTNLFARATWGQAFVRTTLLLNASTTITKKHGESAVVADIREGDRIDVDGALSSGAEGLIITVRTLRDHALLRDGKTLSGTIKSISGSDTFVLTNKTFGTTTIFVPSSVSIVQGARTITTFDLRAGQKILTASGSYDYATNTLTVNVLEVYQDPSLFKGKNFEGTLERIDGTTLPAVLVVKINGSSYTVYLSGSTSVLSKSKAPTKLSRFVVGDTVRLFGTIRKTNLSEIDAEVVRDVNF